MAIQRKLSDLGIKNTPDYSEYVHILDVNDLTDSPQGTDKRVLLPNPKSSPTQIRLSASTTILPSWNGAIVIITAPGVVLTVPGDLPVITFDAITRPNATCNFALTSPKTWVNGTPTIVAEKSTFVFVVDSLNSNEIYVIKAGATAQVKEAITLRVNSTGFTILENTTIATEADITFYNDSKITQINMEFFIKRIKYIHFTNLRTFLFADDSPFISYNAGVKVFDAIANAIEISAFTQLDAGYMAYVPLQDSILTIYF